MLNGAASFNEDLNSWDVSSVTNMAGMFRDATVFNQPIDAWDVSNVTWMFHMFRDAAALQRDQNV